MRIMDSACCDEAVARAVESLWKKRFVTDAPNSSPDLIVIHAMDFCYE